MNASAKQHITKARECADRGDGSYREAGEEILKARSDGATWTEIQDGMGRGEFWCRTVAAFAKTPANTPLPAEGLFGGKSAETKGRGVIEAGRVLRDYEPEKIADMLEDPQVRANVAAARTIHETRREDRTGIPIRNQTSAPTFISLVLKINGWLDELVGMVERGEADVPSEFSTQSLTDIGVKAMRLKEIVDGTRESDAVVIHD